MTWPNFRAGWLRASLGLLCLAWACLPQHAGAQNPPLTYPAPWVQAGTLTSIPATTSTSNAQLGWVNAVGYPVAPPSAWVCNIGSNNAYVAFGGSGVTASANNFLVVNGQCNLLALGGAAYVAALSASSTTTVTISSGSGAPLSRNFKKGNPVTVTYLLYNTNGKFLLNAGGFIACNAC